MLHITVRNDSDRLTVFFPDSCVFDLKNTIMAGQKVEVGYHIKNILVPTRAWYLSINDRPVVAYECLVGNI